MSEKIKFAVVGCGHIGKRHAEMVSRNAECELVALIDVKDKSSLGIENYEVPFFSSLDAFLNSGIEVDVINIASPNGFHFEQSYKAISAGKHIVVEKPMALNKQDAEKLIFQALHKHKQVFAVMQNRYSPPSAWVKEMVESGKLGKIFMVQLNCYWNRDDRYYKPESWHGKLDLDGGTLFTQFSHFIDIMSVFIIVISIVMLLYVYCCSIVLLLLYYDSYYCYYYFYVLFVIVLLLHYSYCIIIIVFLL
jgi:predicted dehydrogenase